MKEQPVHVISDADPFKPGGSESSGRWNSTKTTKLSRPLATEPEKSRKQVSKSKETSWRHLFFSYCKIEGYEELLKGRVKEG